MCLLVIPMNMFFLPIHVLFFTISSIQGLLTKNEETESFYGLVDVAANLMSIDNSDIIIISDFEHKQQVSSDYKYFDFDFPTPL